MLKSEELFNFYSHLFGMIAAVFGTVFLIDAAPSTVSMVVVAAIYGLSISFLLLESSLYHFFKRQENELRVLCQPSSLLEQNSSDAED